MSNKGFEKINDVSNSPWKQKFLEENLKPKTNLAVAMGRVSTKGQKDYGNSDEAQIERIEEYAREEDLKIVKIWDIAETASKHEKRKNFIAMLEYVKANSDIKHILFSHQSRSNRNRESARELESLIRSSSVVLHCVRDNLILSANSPLDDWLRWDIFNNLNEKFIKDHTRNVMDGLMKHVEMGLFPGRAPLGYKNHRETEKGLSVFKVDPITSEYVKLAFDLFSTGNYSEAALKKELDPKFPYIKTPDQKRFSDFLRNPFYYGEFRYEGVLYKGHREYHPRLIGFELWTRVQNLLNQPLRSKRKVTERNHPYVGLIKCAGKILDENGIETEEVCGCSVTGEEKRKKLASGEVKKFHYYHCSNNSKRRCSQRNKGYLSTLGRKVTYTETEIEELFLAVFKPLQYVPNVVKWMQDIVLKHHEEKKEHHKKHIAALQDRYKMLDSYIDKAFEEKMAGRISEEMWIEKNDKWRLEQETIQTQIGSLRDSKQDYIKKAVLLIELTQDFESAYKKINSEKKRKLVEAVSSNHKLRNGTIEFDYRKPFDLLAKSTPKENWALHH